MSFRNKIAIGFGAALTIMILVGAVAYRSTVKSDEDRLWVTHTQFVLEEINSTMTDLLNAETGERGYILTGDPSFLEPYKLGLQRIDQDLKKLRDATKDNPAQQKNLDVAEPLIAERLAMLRDRIEVRKQGGLETGAEIVRQGPGKQHMDRIRAELDNMTQAENRLLDLRTRAAAASSRNTKFMIAAGGSLAVAFLCLAGVVVGHEMNRRKIADEAVLKLNAELEERVAERTAELTEQAKDLARSNSDLQQFAYVASHDLQEPLRMVASFTQLLAKRYSDKLDHDARDFINYAVDGAMRMQTLISDLLNYSRVGTQGKPLVATDANEVLKKVQENLKLAIEESGAAIAVDTLPVVIADPLQLGLLFQNLIANAIKFHGQEPPKVHISSSKNGDQWKISVRDNGIGIAAEHMDRIFVIFQRLHTKAEYPGTGIGLAICKKIVERHGGRIWIEPSPGGGTTFCFTIGAGDKRMEARRPNEFSYASHTN